MKNLKLFFVLFATCLFSACSNSTTITFTVENTINVERIDESVIVTKAKLLSLIPNYNEKFIPMLLNNKGEKIPFQLDDLNGDNSWDELAFVYNFKAKEKAVITIKLVSKDKMPKFKIRTNVHLGIGNKDDGFKSVTHAFSPKGYTGLPIMYQAESVSWENDIIAFRDYFDIRNAKDLFGKLTTEMVMDKVGTKEVGSYHILSDWGVDILHCGASLGAGGLALYKNEKLYRLGSVDKFGFNIVSEGPVRSIFDLTFEGWDIDGKKKSAVERISIYAGKYYFKSDVTISDIEKGETLAIGIVTSKLIDKKPFNFSASNFKCLATHDKQCENKDILGMAVIVPENQFGIINDAPSIEVAELGAKNFEKQKYGKAVVETTYITQNILSNKKATHYFFAAWGRQNKKMNSKDEFIKLIKVESLKLDNVIVIK